VRRKLVTKEVREVVQIFDGRGMIEDGDVGVGKLRHTIMGVFEVLERERALVSAGVAVAAGEIEMDRDVLVRYLRSIAQIMRTNTGVEEDTPRHFSVGWLGCAEEDAL